ITSIKYISKEDGLKKYREMFGETSYLLDGLDNAENPLPNSFRISVDDLSILKETISEIQQINGVIKINAALEIADTVTEVKHAVAIAGSFIVALLVIVSFVIIANTIKITVFNRRKEINIMKYVGATDSFIRLPFIIEGMLIGLISAVIAFFALWIGYGYLVDWVMKNPSPMIASIYTNIVPFVQIAKPLSLGFLGSGIGIGVIGSMMFVRKYLKV
ncbi:MAG TPA: ABC transporter permease, partial [Ruminococcaceae bacterium]|nr:ABC transporter permease [Oscillospiraceae bacterium]